MGSFGAGGAGSRKQATKYTPWKSQEHMDKRICERPARTLVKNAICVLFQLLSMLTKGREQRVKCLYTHQAAGHFETDWETHDNNNNHVSEHQKHGYGN